MQRSYGTIHWPYATEPCQSITTQKMIGEHVQPDTFTLPLIPSWVTWGSHWIDYLRHLNHNLHKMKQVLAQHIWLKSKLTQVTQVLSCTGHTHCHEALWLDKEWNKQTPQCTSNSQHPFQLVSNCHCGIQGQWWKTPSHWLQGSEQGHMEVHVAHAKGWRHFLKTRWCKILLHP